MKGHNGTCTKYWIFCHQVPDLTLWGISGKWCGKITWWSSLCWPISRKVDRYAGFTCGTAIRSLATLYYLFPTLSTWPCSVFKDSASKADLKLWWWNLMLGVLVTLITFRGGDSLVGRAADWKARRSTEAGSSPRSGKGFFLPESVLRCLYSPRVQSHASTSVPTLQIAHTDICTYRHRHPHADPHKRTAINTQTPAAPPPPRRSDTHLHIHRHTVTNTDACNHRNALTQTHTYTHS